MVKVNKTNFFIIIMIIMIIILLWICNFCAAGPRLWAAKIDAPIPFGYVNFTPTI